MITNVLAVVFFIAALIAAILGIVGASITHLDFWTLAFLAAGFLSANIGGVIVIGPRQP